MIPLVKILVYLRRLVLCAGMLSVFTLSSAQVRISGHVTASVSGEALVGVNVYAVGTTSGTITDLEGYYSLEVESSDQTLVFSMVGMITRELPLEGRSTLDVELDEDLIGLEEVVVVGYGTMKKSDVAGSIVSVSGEELTSVKSNNILESLQGKIAGVDITPSDGRSGSGVGIQVRGKRSLNATNSPLIIVDGIPQSSVVSDINPNDIESIEIIKDAASTAIYGSRGANGIIIITTKKGQEGESTVYYNGYYSLADPYQKVPVYDREGYINTKIDAYRDYTDENTFLLDPELSEVFKGSEAVGYADGSFTDWQDLVLRNGFVSDHHVGVRGGSEKLSYNTSISRFDQKGVVLGDQFRRISGRIYLEAKVGKRLNIGNSTLLSQNIRDGRGPNFNDAVKMPPIVAAYDSTGQYIYQPALANPRISPLAQLDDTEERKISNIHSTFYADLKITDWLSLRSNFGLKYSTLQRGYTYPQKDPLAQVTESGMEVEFEQGYTWNNILTADRIFGNHHLIFTGVFELQHNKEEPFMFGGYNQASDRSLWYNLASTETESRFLSNPDPDEPANTLSEYNMLSVLSRLNYSYRGKYIASMVLRRDAASVLSSEDNAEYFPGASIAWRLGDEAFMEPLSDVVNDLKIRASYGSTGNASIPPYSKYGGLNQSPMYFEFGRGADIYYSAYRPALLASSDLKWERTNQFNVGIDFALFKSRLSGSLDLFKANTENILMLDKVVPSSGYYAVWTNAASTESEGIEAILSAYVISRSDFTWKIGINVFANRNRITQLVSGIEKDEGNGWFVGEPIDVYYDYDMIGIWQTDEVADAAPGLNAEHGLIRVRDVNQDTVINSDDRVVLGQRNPKWSGTVDNTFTFRNWTFSFSIYGRFGHMIDAGAYAFDPRMLNNQVVFDYWTPLNPSNTAPRLDWSGSNMDFMNVLRYKDGSFVKLRNITLAYELPREWLAKVPVSRVNLYVSSKNTAILYSTLDEGIDPERGGSISWPLSRLYTFGVNVEF
jgi:TonB-dependent starch-binding outer membrane protein SusC